jgi:hypothetical protein
MPAEALTLISLALLPAAAPPAEEALRYFRAGVDKPALECEFVVRRTDAGWSIAGTTHRGKLRMLVAADYDKAGRLLEARARETAADTVKTAAVRVAEGKATVTRHDGIRQEFAVEPNVIVTSAPDWTDTLLLCRRYDRKAGGRQSFPGLWIHPVQPARAPTFTVERAGADEIAHGGGMLRLHRLVVTLRPGSAYVAWADERGTMVRLAPLPFKAGSGLVLEGFEKSAAGLTPPQGD